MPLIKKSLVINGGVYKFTAAFTVSSLLDYLNFNKNIIVIDYNGAILQKEIWSDTKLRNADRIEILTIAGGG